MSLLGAALLTGLGVTNPVVFLAADVGIAVAETYVADALMTDLERAIGLPIDDIDNSANITLFTPTNRPQLTTSTSRMAAKRAPAKRTMKRSTKKYTSKRMGRMVRTQASVYAPEMKHFDKVLNMQVGMGDWSTGTIAPVSFLGFNPVQGPDWNQRVGRKVKLISIELNMCLSPYIPGTVLAAMAQCPNGGATVFCELWMDIQCKGAAPSINDIYDSTTVVGPTASLANWQSPRNVANLKRFKRIMRTAHVATVTQTDAAATTTAWSSQPAAAKLIKVNKMISYTDIGTGSAITGCADVAFFMICGSTVWSIITGNTPFLMHGGCRFNYVDV